MFRLSKRECSLPLCLCVGWCIWCKIALLNTATQMRAEKSEKKLEYHVKRESHQWQQHISAATASLSPYTNNRLPEHKSNFTIFLCAFFLSFFIFFFLSHYAMQCVVYVWVWMYMYMRLYMRRIFMILLMMIMITADNTHLK